MDLDGTLVDTMPSIYSASCEVAEHWNLRPMPRQKVRGLIGAGAAKMVDELLQSNGILHSPKHLVDDMQAGLELAKLAHSAKDKCYPSVISTLEILRDEDVSLAICTNKEANITKAVLDLTGLSSLVSTIVADDGSHPGKPDPAPITAALTQMAVPSSATLMVGDTSIDGRAARAAGIRFCQVLYGYGEIDRAADNYVNDFADLRHAVG